MPVHAGTSEMLYALTRDYRVVVLTARDGDPLKWSIDWLNLHALAFDEIVGSGEATKSRHGVDALVDDYLGNVAEFLANSHGGRPSSSISPGTAANGRSSSARSWTRSGSPSCRPF
jgi:hypothetical protein